MSLPAAQWSAFKAPEAGFYLLPTRAWEILIGACVALHASNEEHGIARGSGFRKMAAALGSRLDRGRCCLLSQGHALSRCQRVTACCRDGTDPAVRHRPQFRRSRPDPQAAKTNRLMRDSAAWRRIRGRERPLVQERKRLSAFHSTGRTGVIRRRASAAGRCEVLWEGSGQAPPGSSGAWRDKLIDVSLAAVASAGRPRLCGDLTGKVSVWHRLNGFLPA